VDSALLLNRDRLSTDAVRDFFREYLCIRKDAGVHHTVLFHDGLVPRVWTDGLRGIPETELRCVDVRAIDAPAQYLVDNFDVDRAYVSVHEFLVDRLLRADQSAASVVRRTTRMDYTSYEFPRFGCTSAQRDCILARHTAGRPARQRAVADRFFALLQSRVPYTIEVRSGSDSVLRVCDVHPWLELCGPLAPGDVRFIPGCEVFYSGKSVNGRLHARSGLNLLAFRRAGAYPPNEIAVYDKLLAADRALRRAPVDFVFEEGVVVAVEGPSRPAELLREIMETTAYRTVNEVGIGVNECAGPMIGDFAATSNEAIPGIHVGLGADPGQPSRFTTSIHFDVVEPEVEIRVNGHLFFSAGDGFTGVEAA
jgi:hypothetical protein